MAKLHFGFGSGTDWFCSYQKREVQLCDAERSAAHYDGHQRYVMCNRRFILNPLYCSVLFYLASWFPTLNQGAFEIQMAHLLKNAHSRCKTKVNDSGESPPVNSPASSKDLEASLNVEVAIPRLELYRKLI